MDSGNREIVKVILENLTGQVEMLAGLSLAFFGGFAALLAQIYFHNMGENRAKITTSAFFWRWLAPVSLTLNGLSFLSGYLARAVITGTTPGIFRVNMAPLDNWADAVFPGSDLLRYFMLAQLASFVVGVLCLTLFIIRNLRVIINR